MVWKFGLYSSVLFLTFLFALVLVFPAYGESSHLPIQADSPYDLINAVNGLRVSYGVPAYNINSTLMYTAQSHAEFMAATGNVSHTGAGGSSATDRLLAAGYPLAGDLSLGGFRSENITGGSEGMTAQTAVNQWTGDALHLNTMISPDLTEIGAGVAVANGRVYYVIDCAQPRTSGGPQSSSTQSSGGGTTVQVGEVPISLLVISTPNQSGAVFHLVLSGQTLWQIAIAYNVKILDIKTLNNLPDDNIYPGDTLLIKNEIPAVNIPTATSAFASTDTPTPSITFTSLPNTAVPTSTVAEFTVISTDTSSTMSVVIGLVALTILAGGYIAWRGNSQADSK